MHRRSSQPRFSKIFQNSQENTCASVSFSIKLKVLPHVFSEFCEIFKSIFLIEYLWATASGIGRVSFLQNSSFKREFIKSRTFLKPTWISISQEKLLRINNNTAVVVQFECKISNDNNLFVLTLKDPFISESCIEIKIELNFYFHTSLWCLKRFCEGL